jgi:lysophospholipase L1-like esterase
MKHIRQKLSVLVIGIMAATILLEAGIRMAGAFYMKGRKPVAESNRIAGKDAYTLLCLGNSWTFGVGAPPGESYPDHLKRMLQYVFKKKDIRVINAGVGGLNSAEMLYRLQPQIENFKPDIIILRTGSPNSSNYTRYSQYLERENRLKNPFYNIILQCSDGLYNKSRVYRLIHRLSCERAGKARLAWNNIRRKIKDKSCRDSVQDSLGHNMHKARNRLYEKLQSERGYAQAIKLSQRLEELMHIFVAGENVTMAVADAEVEQAITWFERALKYKQDNTYYCMALGNIYTFRKEHKKAAEWLIKSILIDPTFRYEDNEEYPINGSYILLNSIYDMTVDLEAKNIIEEFIAEFQKTNPDSSNFFLRMNPKLLYRNDLAEWIASDIDEIVRIIKYNNIDLIIHSYPPPFGYPMWENDPMVLASEILRSKAIELGVPFVDHERLFSEMYAQGCNQEDYHEKIAGKTIQGGHFNEKGYETMAGFVYDKIIEEGFIK